MLDATESYTSFHYISAAILIKDSYRAGRDIKLYQRGQRLAVKFIFYLPDERQIIAREIKRMRAEERGLS